MSSRFGLDSDMRAPFSPVSGYYGPTNYGARRRGMRGMGATKPACIIFLFKLQQTLIGHPSIYNAAGRVVAPFVAGKYVMTPIGTYSGNTTASKTANQDAWDKMRTALATQNDSGVPCPAVAYRSTGGGCSKVRVGSSSAVIRKWDAAHNTSKFSTWPTVGSSVALNTEVAISATREVGGQTVSYTLADGRGEIAAEPFSSCIQSSAQTFTRQDYNGVVAVPKFGILIALPNSTQVFSIVGASPRTLTATFPTFPALKDTAVFGKFKSPRRPSDGLSVAAVSFGAYLDNTIKYSAGNPKGVATTPAAQSGVGVIAMTLLLTATASDMLSKVAVESQADIDAATTTSPIITPTSPIVTDNLPPIITIPPPITTDVPPITTDVPPITTDVPPSVDYPPITTDTTGLPTYTTPTVKEKPAAEKSGGLGVGALVAAAAAAYFLTKG